MKIEFVGETHMVHSVFEVGKQYDCEPCEIDGEMDVYKYLVKVGVNGSIKSVYFTDGLFNTYFKIVEG